MPSVTLALSLFWPTVERTFSALSLVCSTAAACSVAAWESDCEAPATWSEALASLSTDVATSVRVAATLVRELFAATRSSSSCPADRVVIRPVRSPASIAVRTRATSLSGPITVSRVWLMPSTMTR